MSENSNHSRIPGDLSALPTRRVARGGHFAKPSGGDGVGAAATPQAPGAQSAPASGRRFSAAGHPASPASAKPSRPSAGSRFAGKPPAPVAVPAVPSRNGVSSGAAPAVGAPAVTGSIDRLRRSDASAPTGQLVSGSVSTSNPRPAATEEFHRAAAKPDRDSRRAPVGAYAAPARRSASKRAFGGAAVTGAASGGEPPRGPRPTRVHRGGDGGPDRPRRGGNILSTLLIVVGVVLLLAAGGIFINAQLGYKEAQSTYAELEQYAVKDGDGDKVPQVDFDELRSINDDVVGWIYAPGTPINYPVVQTSDNTTYLDRLFDGTSNPSGSIFMDMDDTAPGMVDDQTTLYGHHMNDERMFNIIDRALDQSVFDGIKVVYYITPEHTYKLTPIMDAQVQEDYIEARRPNFDSDEAFKDYLYEMLGQAKAKASDADELIDSSDQVMSLVTCSGAIVPRTTRAVMVCSIEEVTDRS